MEERWPFIAAIWAATAIMAESCDRDLRASVTAPMTTSLMALLRPGDCRGRGAGGVLGRGIAGRRVSRGRLSPNLTGLRDRDWKRLVGLLDCLGGLLDRLGGLIDGRRTSCFSLGAVGITTLLTAGSGVTRRSAPSSRPRLISELTTLRTSTPPSPRFFSHSFFESSWLNFTKSASGPSHTTGRLRVPTTR